MYLIETRNYASLQQYFSIIHIIVALILLQRLNIRQNRILHHTTLPFVQLKYIEMCIKFLM